jgi:hypothetical protein
VGSQQIPRSQGADEAWYWEIATDPGEVHRLLCACDAYQATPEVPAPERSIGTTVRRVADGSVHLLRCRGVAVAMFAFTWEAPFSESRAHFPPARRPAYVSRLAVSPRWLEQGTVLGARCYRRVFRLAVAGGADVVRLEANPDLRRMPALLRTLDFTPFGGFADSQGRRRVYLQKLLPGTSTSGD